MGTEKALWAAVGANPGDSLPRLVLADWYDERAGTVRCLRCKIIAGKNVCPDCVNWKGRVPKDCRCRGTRRINCPTCSGTGFVSDGRADLAAALRATSDRMPYFLPQERLWTWWASDKAIDVGTGHLDAEKNESSRLPLVLHGHLKPSEPVTWAGNADYPTALAAIRDLCRAWVKVNCKGVPA